MSSEENGAASQIMSETLSSSSDSGQEMTNETEEYQDEEEVYSLEIFEAVKKGLRTDRRVILYAAETKQCLQAILAFVDADRYPTPSRQRPERVMSRISAEEFRHSREFLTQVFPLLWKHVVREDPGEGFAEELVAWGRLLIRIAIALMDKLSDIELFKVYQELAVRALSCLEFFFESDALMMDQQMEESGADSWSKPLALEIIDTSLERVIEVITLSLLCRVEICE